MTWYLLLVMVGSVQVIHIDGGKSACEDIKLAVTAEYGKGSGFVSARCIAVDGDTPRPRK